MTEWETKLRDFSSGTCHDDCCQENASLANAVDAALDRVRTLEEALDGLVFACEFPGQHCEVEPALRVARAALAGKRIRGWKEVYGDQKLLLAEEGKP